MCKCGKAVASFGYEDGGKVCCVECKDDAMVSKNKRCYTDGCNKQAFYTYEGHRYCTECNHNVNGDYNNKRVFIRKEHLVLCELERICVEILCAIKSKWDEGIGSDIDVTTCKGKRPDMLYYFPDYILIIEIDEDAHQSRGYCISGEKKKMNEIFEQLSPHNLPIGWIRFNPDSYTETVTGVVHKSMFERYKRTNGEYAIRAGTGVFEERMQVLSDLATQMVEQKTEGVRFLNYGKFEYDPGALDDLPEGLDDLTV